MRKLKIVLLVFLGLIILIPVWYISDVWLAIPDLEEYGEVKIEITEVSDTVFTASDGAWLQKNDAAVWELYLTGNALERGMAFGKLARTLAAEKESAFIGEIQNRIPSPSYLNTLKYMIGWFNRDMDDYIAEEYLVEIYAASQAFPDSFDFVAPKYHRALSYHGAHDIGHALQNMNLVGCTSLAVWGDNTENGNLLIGRNFDFYFGREFAEDPIIAFVNPDKGYPFMSVTWACFSGVVSGMNNQGISVTLNAAKSEIPTKGKTPVSLIAREILQYASNVEEAVTIAKNHESFVAETFLLGSKNDGKAVLIEKTPERTEVFETGESSIYVTNHFQSDSLKSTELNQAYMAEEVSIDRWSRMKEITDSLEPYNPERMAHMLRDKQGKGGEPIGLSNEKSINQLLAHHSIIFSPMDLKVWISSPPYQLGKYLAYDLNEVFDNPEARPSYIDSISIPADPFMETVAFTKFQKQVKIKEAIETFLYTGNDFVLTPQQEADFIAGNPNGFLTYYYLGNYYEAKENWTEAIKNFEIGLTKNVAKVSERKFMEENLSYCITQIHD